ncbi:MAG: filamentous hemagglutinin N-terminal domain-containing protein [Paucibacter sp.]|nr:filamentous hemagglutinin N-terminal domain-containing protein [Roseateles sp.]
MKLTFTALTLAIAALPLQAQIRTDGSVGPAAQTLIGPSYRIPQSLGQLSGSNLFQSFQTFKLASGESATFTTSSAGITNVISRVTGGEVSTILGQISLVPFSGAPAFYFINPAGVVFGQGASINVPGAFIISTANSLRFADGARLFADLGQNSSFSTAAPEAFGFLGSTRGTIALRDQAVLAPAAGQRVALVGGDVLIDNGIIASSGEVSITAVGAQAGDVPLNVTAPSSLPTSSTSLSPAGQFTMQGGALIGSSSVGNSAAGPVSIAAGDISLSAQSSISSFTGATAGGDGASIQLLASGTVALTGAANLYAVSSSSGRGGGISVSAGNIALDTGAYIQGGTQSGSTGNGGDVLIRATQALRLDGGASIFSSVSGSGQGGVVDVGAGTIGLNGGAYLANLALGGTGNAGDLRVQASGSLQMAGGSQLLAYTTAAGNSGNISLGAGDIVLTDASAIRSAAVGSALTGDVTLTVSGDLTLHAGSSIANVGLSGGQAGNIGVTARNVTLDGASFMTTGSLDANGTGGNVQVNAGGTISLSGGAYISANTFTDVNAGSVTLSGQNISLNGASLSSAAVDGHGDAGSITLVATQRVDVTGASTIGSASSTSGQAGQVSITAGDFSLNGPGLIFTGAGAPASGPAGTIRIAASGSLAVSNGGEIDSSTYSLLSPAGAIALQAGTTMRLDGAALSSRSASPAGSGSAGAIGLVAGGQMTLTNGTSVSTSTLSAGNAGQISLRAAGLWLQDSSLASLANTGSQGAAGTINIAAQGDVLVLNSLLSTTTRGTGAAGTVRMSAANIQIAGTNGGVTAAAAAGSGGQTGNVEITASGRFGMSQGAALTIQNDATVSNPGALTPTLLSVDAARIELQDAAILAASSGNVAASRIVLTASNSMNLQDSIVSTSANQGNGGALSLQGGRLLRIADTQVTTSVLGTQGNGGNISVSADGLLMQTGFIQANTAARNARGGLVVIDVGTLLASASSLFVGGAVPLSFKAGVYGYNVIQAAAPTGVSGVISITSPVLDLAGSLVQLNAHLLDPGGLGRDPCRSRGGSSLALAGRGGLAPSARGLMTGRPAGGEVGATGAASGMRLSLDGPRMDCP